MKSRAAVASVHAPERAYSPEEDQVVLQAASDIRIEDLGDGTAQVNLRLPWPLVVQVLDLASIGDKGVGRAAS